MDDDAELIAFYEAWCGKARASWDYSISRDNLRRLLALASRPYAAALQARVEELERMLAEADAAHAGYSVVYSEHRTLVNVWREEAIARYRARPASAPGDAGERTEGALDG